MSNNNYGYAYATKWTARRYTNRTRTVRGITIHHWGSMGSSFDGIISWFCASTTSAQTSAHYVAQGTDAGGTFNERVACIVDPDLIAWHAGDWQANVDTIGIECRPEARDSDYDVIAELVARLWGTYGVVPLYPHKHWVTTACPGRYDIARIKREASIKYAALRSTGKPPVTTPPVQEDDMPYSPQEIREMAGVGVHNQQLGRSNETIGVVLERLSRSEGQITSIEKTLTALHADIPRIVQDAVAAALANVKAQP